MLKPIYYLSSRLCRAFSERSRWWRRPPSRWARRAATASAITTSPSLSNSAIAGTRPAAIPTCTAGGQFPPRPPTAGQQPLGELKGRSRPLLRRDPAEHHGPRQRPVRSRLPAHPEERPLPLRHVVAHERLFQSRADGGRRPAPPQHQPPPAGPRHHAVPARRASSSAPATAATWRTGRPSPPRRSSTPTDPDCRSSWTSGASGTNTAWARTSISPASNSP